MPLRLGIDAFRLGPRNNIFSQFQNAGNIPIPNPPYAVFSRDLINVLSIISNLNYTEGFGPSAASADFSLVGAGLSPAASNITITPNADFTTNFEYYNPNTLSYTSALSVIVYVGGAISLSGFKVRAKAGLSTASISGTLTITAPNTAPFVLTCNGVISAFQGIIITGGSIVQVGNYKTMEITADTILNITAGIDDNNLTYEVIGAGGGGGWGYAGVAGAGGGAGAVNASVLNPVSGLFPAIIGVSGKGGTTSQTPTSGGSTSFGNITAVGGGRGCIYQNYAGRGGSGGGGYTEDNSGAGGLGVVNQGNVGGTSTSFACGGGGGYGGAGGNTIGNKGGAGGIGFTSSINGLKYAGGGGGGGYVDIGGLAAVGYGGGNGGSQPTATAATNATSYGSGGGGGYNGSTTGGDGYQGVVLLKWYSPA